MANNWYLGAVAHLDGTKSKNQLNQDIQALKKVLDKVELKATLDPNQVKNLENQLNKLQVSLTDITIPQSVLDGLVNQINNALRGIQIPNISIGSQAQQAGKQYGQQFHQGFNSAIQKGNLQTNFGFSEDKRNEVAKQAQQYFRGLSNGIVTVNEQMEEFEGKSKLRAFTINIKNAKGEIESLRYSLRNITDGNGNITGQMFSYTGGSINDVNVVKEFAKHQKTVTDFTIKLEKLKATYANANVDYSEYNKVFKKFENGTASVNELRLAFNKLESDIKTVAQGLKSQSASLDPIQQALNNMRDLPSMLKTLEANMGSIKDKTNIAGISVSDFTNKYEELKSQMTDDKVPLTEQWIKDYQELMSSVTSVTKQVEALKKAESSDNSDVKHAKELYDDIIATSKKLNSLKLEQLKLNPDINVKEWKDLESEIDRFSKKYSSLWTEFWDNSKNPSFFSAEDLQVLNDVGRSYDKAKSKIADTTVIERSQKAYDDLLATIKELNSLEKKQAKLNPDTDTKLWNEFAKQIDEVSKKYEKLLNEFWSTDINKNIFSLEDLSKLDDEFTKATNAIDLMKAKIQDVQDKNVNKIQHLLNVGDYDVQLKSFEIALRKVGFEGDELKNKLNGVKTALSTLRTSATGDDIIPSTVVENARLLDIEVEKLSNDIKLIKLDDSLIADDIRVKDTITKLNEQLRKNRNYTNEAKESFESWIHELEKGNVAVGRLKEINSEAKELHHRMANMGNIGKSPLQTLVSGWQKFAEWTIATASFADAVQSIKTCIDNVVKLDSKLLELNKVFDTTADGLERVTKRAYELGDTVGKTGTQVVDAVTEFKRAGYDIEESFDMAEAALVMTNVAEGITETSDAAGTLISVLKGFNMNDSDAMKIVDMINSTSNKSPIGFDQLAEGLERTAGTLSQSGNTIEQTIGLLTAGYAQLRNVEKVSQGLITISARIRGVGEDGETIDGLASKMSEDFAKIGVAVENADGSLRSIYKIAQDYAKELPNLTDKQKQYYAELAAGKHQVTVWNSIVKQFQDAENATTQALDSVGSTSEENQKYLDSISGKIEILNSAIEKLSNTVLDSDLIKFFVDLGTIGVKSADGLINALSPLGTIATIVSGFLGAKGSGLTNYVTQS